MAKRTALITAAAVEVHCPHCGEPQPAPDNGSDMWLLIDFQRACEPPGAELVCGACDESMKLNLQSRVSVSAAPVSP